MKLPGKAAGLVAGGLTGLCVLTVAYVVLTPLS